MNQKLASEMVIERVIALCEIPSVSRNEDRIGSVAAEFLRKDGLEVEEQQVEDRRRNVIARLRTGRPGPKLLFNGHLDTLPPPTSGWTRDPYKPEIIDGRIYAAEINNMKGAVGGMMASMAKLVACADMLCGEIALTAVVGECDSLGIGTVTVLERGLTADLCINGEPTDLAVMTAHAGVVQLRLIVTGRPAHVSQRKQGIDAIAKLVALLASVTEDALSYESHEDFPGLPTVHVGTVKGGFMASMLADRAEAGIDVRTVPGMTAETVLSDFERLLRKAREIDPNLLAEVKLSSRPDFMHPRAFHMERTATIVETVARAHSQVTGQSTYVGTLIPQVFFGSDASHLLAAGIPTAIYGPGKVTDISTPNESMIVADMVTAANVYFMSALSICGRRVTP